MSKYIENLSAQTDIVRQLLKKDNNWNWTTEHTKAFENIKQKITEIPCLGHYNSDYPNIITTDASTKGLGATLWQKGPWSHALARTTGRKIKTDRIRQSFPFGYGKEVCNQ